MKFLLTYGVKWTDAHPRLCLLAAGVVFFLAHILIGAIQ